MMTEVFNFFDKIQHHSSKCVCYPVDSVLFYNYAAPLVSNVFTAGTMNIL